MLDLIGESMPELIEGRHLSPIPFSRRPRERNFCGYHVKALLEYLFNGIQTQSIRIAKEPGPPWGQGLPKNIGYIPQHR